MNRSLPPLLRTFAALSAGFGLVASAHAATWWKNEWTARAPLTIEAAPGAPAFDGTTPVLVRLHSGNFDFSAVRDDGSDLRFVADDDATPLAYHIERFDALLGEAFVWVKAPAPKAGEPLRFRVYYGNAAAPAGTDAKATYDAATRLVWHFAEGAAPARDWSGHDNNAAAAGSAVDGAIIGSGLRLDGVKTLEVPGSESLAFADKAPLTLAFWFKSSVDAGNAVVYARREGRDALVVALNKGVPSVEITRAGTVTKSAPGAAAAPGKWHHLAVVASGDETTVYLDGVKSGVAGAGIPALKAKATLGGDTLAGATGFNGELDEFSVTGAALKPDAVRFTAINQGPEGANIPALGAVEHAGEKAAGGGEEHTGYFKVIVDSLTFDGWVVIGVLAVMALASWVLMITKVGYLNLGAKGNKVFMRGWTKLSRNLHAIDNGDHAKVESLGGILTPSEQKAVKNSPIYRIFDVGAEEIRHRMTARDSKHVLTAESIEAVRARLDGAMVRETQKLDKLIVILTISISGGPFLGLLGTVVGVMITFAAVAMAGDVNVNAIAPGISAALLATVAGLAVAIPALFGYNYILGRIKDIKADIQVFIDEFVTSMAEFYQPGDDSEPGRKLTRDELDSLLSELAARLHTRRQGELHDGHRDPVATGSGH